MEEVSLTDVQKRASYFQRGILQNLEYWQRWLDNKKISDVMALGRERNNIVRSISFGIDLDGAWSSVYELVTTFSPFMERQGHWETWNWVLTQTVETAQRMQDVVSEVTLSVLLARLLFQQGRFKEAISYYRQVIRGARRVGDQYNEARACTNLGYHYVEQGQWHRAEVLCCYALRLFEQINSDYGCAHTENHLGFLYSRQHRWDQAQQHLEKACEIWQSIGDKHGLMRVLNNLGGLQIRMERPDEAWAYLEQALNLAEATGDQITVGRIYVNMGLANIMSGDMVKAERYTLQAETIFRQFPNVAETARIQGNLGIIYSHQKKWSRAISHLEYSLAGWRKIEDKLGEINTLMDMIEYELIIGDRQQAVVRLKDVEQLLGADHENMQYQYLHSRLEKYRRSLTEQMRQQTATD